MPIFRPRRLSRFNRLRASGLLSFEAREISRQYPSLRVPYIRRLMRARTLYVNNLRSRGFSDERIIRMIRNLYIKKGWLTADGHLDPWKMVKEYRKKTIETGDYNPPPRKHHGLGISKGDVRAQKQRRRARTNLEKYAIGRGRE